MSLDSASMRCCWAVMPVAAALKPSSISGSSCEQALDAAHLVGCLLQRGVDRRDDALAGLEGAQRAHHLDHRRDGVDAAALQRAGPDRPRGRAARGPGEEIVALAAGVR